MCPGCLTYEQMISEIVDIFDAQYKQLTEKGLPKSALAGNIYVLNHMDQFCPCCGKGLKTPTPIAADVKPVPTPAPTPPQRITCVGSSGNNGCNGTGKIMGGLACSHCGGKGYLEIKPLPADFASKLAKAYDNIQKLPKDGETF